MQGFREEKPSTVIQFDADYMPGHLVAQVAWADRNFDEFQIRVTFRTAFSAQRKCSNLPLRPVKCLSASAIVVGTTLCGASSLVVVGDTHSIAGNWLSDIFFLNADLRQGPMVLDAARQFFF